jgi:phosphoglycerol transferase MdoB-like AlkP superfamily enzyme
MAKVTVPLYANGDGNFVTFYVSVSGHSPYNSGDNIAKEHLDTVADLDYSSIVKYYLASQVELDKMLEELINDLEAAGELDNTVIALVGDHYPYTLSIDEVNEAASYKKDSIVEVNHSNFILWNSGMEESIVIDKVGSQIDVLPTLLNLFGVEYDSRTIVGKDILSDYEGLAIFSNNSWVSDYGTYQASQRKFYPKEGMELEGETQEEYVRRMNSRVQNSFSISKMIIDNDYYEYLERSK